MPRKSHSSKGDDRLRELIHKNQIALYRTRGETFRHMGGSLDKISYVLFIVTAAYALLMNTLQILAFSLNLTQTKADIAFERIVDIHSTLYIDYIRFFRNNLWALIPTTIGIVVSLLLLVYRKRLATLIVSVVMAGASIVTYVGMYSSVYLGPRNPIPLWLYFLYLFMPLYAGIIWLIYYRDQRAEQRQFESATQALYRRNASDDKLLSNDDWQKIVEDYEQSVVARSSLTRRRRAYEKNHDD